MILEGRIEVRPARFGPGLDVRLCGEVAGWWTPETGGTTGKPLERGRPRVSLREFLAREDGRSLLVLATDRGYLDLAAAAGDWPYVRVNFGDADRLMDAICALPAERGARAIALARGGSGDLSLEMWNRPQLTRALLDLDLPFYTAIGHSDQLLLVDKYADEAFTTPTDLGHALRRWSWQARQDDQVRRDLEAATASARRSERGKIAWRLVAIALGLSLAAGAVWLLALGGYVP